MRPKSVARIAEIMHQWGYLTSMFGKSHETPSWEVSLSGPFDRWPARQGFDKFSFSGHVIPPLALLVFVAMVPADEDRLSLNWWLTHRRRSAFR
jgi:hypothetical protein